MYVIQITVIYTNITDFKLSLLPGNQMNVYMEYKKRTRYIYALFMIVLMVGAAEILEEKEIIFPEMAALTIGMWIVDKRVWQIKRWHMPVIMTIGAFAGIGIVHFSDLPLVFNLTFAFLFAVICLLIARTSLFPLISACILPVLLGTESWIYPLSVFIMSLVIVFVQKWMERKELRQVINYEPLVRNWKVDIRRWLSVLVSVFAIFCLAVYTSNFYFIIPPLIVAYVEFVNSRAGFRNRPVLTVLLLTTGALIGTVFQLVGYHYLGLPETLVALCIFIVLFFLFEWLGKYFAPVGALALIPMLLPADTLVWLPLQVAVGSCLFIAIGMLFFQQCYKWSRAQLVYCLIPHYLINRINRNKTK